MIAVPILTYHGVNDTPPGKQGSHLFVTPGRFREHVETLVERGYRSMGMSELADCLHNGTTAPGKRVVLTYDDGFRDNYDYALPALIEYGWVGTFYVVVNRVGGIGEWSPKTAAPLLTWEQIQEMHRAGMEIGSHTLSHPNLTRLSPGERRTEIADSRKMLEDSLGDPVRSFCYPFGDFNKEVEREVEEAGYTSACTVMRGNRHAFEGRFRLERIPMHQDVTPWRLIYRTTALYHWEHVAKRWWE